MSVGFTEREIEYLKKLLVKTLRASKKNLSKTKDEAQKELIQKNIQEKEVILEKLKSIGENK